MVSLKKETPPKDISEQEILSIFTQIALAVQYLHKEKIIHRDIKMTNIFINRDKENNQLEAKLGDFGISKILDNTLKMTTTCIGTPFYMSPECCMGLEYSFKSDIWSLGCFLYEICTGERPFHGKRFQVSPENYWDNFIGYSHESQSRGSARFAQKVFKVD